MGISDRVCGVGWAQGQVHACHQAAATAGTTLRVLDYSLLFDDLRGIWVLSGAGELLGSVV